MPWDVLCARLPRGTRRIDALPADFWPPSFEPPPELVTKLRLVPGLEIVDETLAVVRSPDWVVEVDFSTPTRVLLSVEGNDGSVEVIRAVASVLDAVAIDTTSGEAIDFEGDPSSGLRRSRERQEMLDDIADSVPSANDAQRRRPAKLR